ncbi:MAG: type II secretion system secretin GspD [Deltaproteobacteria bacterium]|nr:type II secretion system secretin GspD [Deltaproteobacteria bacterium]
MISKIRDVNDRQCGLSAWKRLIILPLAMVFISSLWLTDLNGIVYADEKDNFIRLNFKDTPIDTVLGYLSETAGVTVIYEAVLTDRITVISKQALGLDDALSLINTILADKGYTAIRTGKTLKIATVAAAKKLNIPVYTGKDTDAIPATDDIITCIIPVSSATAANMQENLSGFLSDNAEFSANDDTNTLILTDSANNIRRIMEIVNAIDTNMAAVAEIKVFRLAYADAEDTADLINDLFESQAQTSSSASRTQGMIQQMMRGQQGNQQGGLPGTTGSAQSSSSTSVNVTAKGDERTNSVVVSASSAAMDVIEKMIEELDSDSSAGEALFVYRLRNAQASNLVDVLNNLFSEMSDSTSTTGGTAQGQEGGRGAMPGQTTGAQTSSSSSSTGLVGDVYIEADEDTNALIIMTSPANYEKVKKVIEDLDKPVPQVLIKVLIAEVTHDGALDLGTEFSFLNNWEENNISSITTDTDFGISALTSGAVATVVGERFDVKLRALAEKGKLNILSKPYILASNNQTATITVGNEVPFVTDSRTTETGQTINTIEYEDIGIILEVTPVINDEGLVTMDVSQEISAISDTTVKISETVDAAVFAKRSSENRVIARSGQTVVIGGLMEDRKTDNVSKVPLLGDIPVLGALFRHVEKDNSKTELLIFITPTVAADDKELVEISNENKQENPMIDKVYSRKDLGFEEGETEWVDAPSLE